MVSYPLLFSLFVSFVIASFSLASNVGMTGDIYVFAYSWQPEFCYGQSTWPGCQAPQPFWKKYFTLHGMWPQYSTGGYPATCTQEALNTSVPIAIGMDTMTQYWPNVQKATTDPDYDSFWDHEWTKHGTCSGLSQTNYFTDSLNLIQKFGTPASVTAAVGSTLSASSLRSDFGGASMVALQCVSSKYLSGAYTCWSQTSGVPSKQIACPADVIKEDTCTASTLVVQSF